MPAAASRTIVVLNALASRREARTVAQLSAETGIARASLSRLLEALRQDGTVRIEEGGRYRPTLQILEPALALLTTGSIREVSFPYMAELSASVGYEVNLGIFEYPDIVFLEKVFVLAGRVTSRLSVHRRPLLASHSGRVMVAFRPAEVMESLLRDGPLSDERSVPKTPDQLREELAFIRQQGYIAFDRHIEISAPAGLSVPILGRGGLAVAGLTIIRNTQLTDGFLHDVLPKALHVAQGISSELGFRRSTISPLM